MTEQGISEIDSNRLELFREGIKNGTVQVDPILEDGKPIVRLTVKTDKEPEELVIKDEIEVAYLIGLKEQSK